MRLHLPFGIRSSERYSSTITKEEYHELMTYATARSIRLEGFKRFSGSISLIKEFIDDMYVVAQDFPRILEGKKSVIVRLDEYSPEDDFATTDYHIISINAKIFANKDYLESEYKMLADKGKFVKGTNYHSVAWHEIGHVVANIYDIKPMAVARQIMPESNISEITKYVKQNISLYAADYEDGREFISECFSAYYGNVDIDFANQYVEICKKIVKEELKNDEKQYT